MLCDFIFTYLYLKIFMPVGNENDDDIEMPAKLYCCSILFFIIGLPMFCMGYIKSNPSLNLAGYIHVSAVIKTPYTASFYYNSNKMECRYLTEFDGSCLSDYTCKTYREYYYPINSNVSLLYLPSSGYCRTEKFVNNLAIAGIVFLGLTMLCCIGMCTSFKYISNNYSVLNDDDLHFEKKHAKKYVKLFNHLDNKCSICDCEYTDNNYIVALKNCGHCFHNKCVEKSLNNDNNCPLCRQKQTTVEIV